MGSGPSSGGERLEALDGPVGKTGQNGSEVVAQWDLETAAGLDNRNNGGYFRACLLAADMDPVLAAQLNKALKGVTVTTTFPKTSLGAQLKQVAQIINAFYTALNDELMMEDNVTLFTESDFSRTFQPTTGDGSDHAWGSHHVVLGGAVKGQKIYGTFPTFALGSDDDFDTRGRWIPSSSVDQYGASLVDWFGVDPSKVFPNLANFPSKKNPFTFFG